MVLEEKLNNEKTNGSEYLKLDIPSEYLAAPGQSEGIGAGGGGGEEQSRGLWLTVHGLGYFFFVNVWKHFLQLFRHKINLFWEILTKR